MTDRIEVDFNGITIHYSENEDLWRCASFDVEGKTLSAVKAKVNKLLADARRLARRLAEPIAVFTVDSWSMKASEKGVVTLVESDKKVWLITTKTVWWKGEQREEKARSKIDIEREILDTPEARAVLKDVREKIAALEARIRTEKARIEALPRLTPEMISKLPKEASA